MTFLFTMHGVYCSLFDTMTLCTPPSFHAYSSPVYLIHLFLQISHAPPGTQACTLDIKKFHRTCPVLPSHKPWLVVQGISGEFFINHAHPFGAACASSNAGMIANAVVDIWRAEGVFPVPKYEDDLKAFRFPSTSGQFVDGSFRYDYDRSEMLRRISPLGVPWHDEKGDERFSFVTTFIGFLWDIPQKLVSLPDGKRNKFHQRVLQFLVDFDGRPCHLRDVEKIHGSLCHIAFVYLDGRSHLPSLSNFASTFHNNEFLSKYPPHSLITDLKWWLVKLSLRGISRSLRPLGPLSDLGLYVDASTSWGIGIIINGEWAAFQLSPSWKIEGRDICWLETVAIELLTYFLESRGLRDIHLLVHSDNQGTIGALDKGRSGNIHVNLAVRRTHLTLMAISAIIKPIYIESHANPADPISRGEPGPVGKQIFPSFKLPDELSSCFLNA